MSNILIIAKKEINHYFNNPVGYIVLIVFLAVWEFLFFQSVFLAGEASLRILFALLPWVFIFLIPILTMQSICQEKNSGTLELLLTHPLQEIEVILGKFLGGLGFIIIILVLTVPIGIAINTIGVLDWGVIAGQYASSILLAAAFLALGIFISAIFTSQISVVLVSIIVNLFLVLFGMDMVTMRLPLAIAEYWEQLTILSHFNVLTRGVLDAKDVLYFLSIITIFLSWAYLLLLGRKFDKQHSFYRNSKIGIILLLGIVILINTIVRYVPLRYDLTSDKIYSLSKITEKQLLSLPDVVNIVLYTSDKLPPKFQLILRDTKDLLRDYQALSKGNVVVKYKNISGNSEIAKEASQVGITEVQFNIIESEEFKIQSGYLGLSIDFAGVKEVIPFIENTNQLEYQLTSIIKKLTVTKKNKIAFVSGHGEKKLEEDYRIWGQELKNQFEVIELKMDDKNFTMPKDLSVLVVAGPTQEMDSEARVAIKKFIASGGRVLFLIDPTLIIPGSLQAAVNPFSLADLALDYGVVVNSDIVYDVKFNEVLRFNKGNIVYLLPYPYWMKAKLTDDIQKRFKLDYLVLPWASSISIKDNTKLASKEIQPLITTSKFGGNREVLKITSVEPEEQFSHPILGQQYLGVNIKAGAGRVVIIGDSDFLTDSFLQSTSQNLVLGMGLLSDLTQEDSLISLSLKQSNLRSLQPTDFKQVLLIKYGNLALVVFLPLLVGVWRLMRRRKLSKKIYV